jgi:hypothetical protein
VNARDFCQPYATLMGRPGTVGQSHRIGDRGSAVLTDLLTTILDHHGHVRNEKPSEQGRRDTLDAHGQSNPPRNA